MVFIKKLPKKLLTIISICLTMVLLIVTCFFALPKYISSKPQDVGFVEGLFQDPFSAYGSGKKEGLSAKDTTVEIASDFEEIQSLQVLVANVTFNNFISVGKKGDEKYAALQFVRGKASFSVDLSKADIKQEKDNTLKIVLPKPDAKITVNMNDVNNIKTKAEYKKWFFDGSTNDGYEAFLNSAKRINELTEKEIDNYDSLIKMAQQSAKKQIEELVQGTSVNKQNLSITFKAEGKDE